MEDYTLYPMIRPGAFIQIDDQDTKIDPDPGENEFERPIYFFQLREGYAYGWCELEGKVLSIIPQIGRASCRERMYMTEVVESLKEKILTSRVSVSTH